MKTSHWIFLSLGIVFSAVTSSVISKGSKQGAYAEGYKAGSHYIIAYAANRKLLRSPDEIKSGNYTNCIFVKVIEPSIGVSFGGTSAMHMNFCTIYCEGISGALESAVRIRQ